MLRDMRAVSPAAVDESGFYTHLDTSSRAAARRSSQLAPRIGSNNTASSNENLDSEVFTFNKNSKIEISTLGIRQLT